MQRTHRSWLPGDAIATASLDRDVAELARSWSAKWFTGAGVRPLAGQAPPARSAAKAQWLTLEDIAIAVRPGARDCLAAMMLGAARDDRAATDADHHVFSALADGCIGDLCRRVALLFRLSPEARWTQREAAGRPDLPEPRDYCLGTDAPRPLIDLLIGGDVIVARAKAGLPPRPEPPALPPLAAGLTLQPIKLSALVGRCRLTLSDLAGLAPGDVLVFDAPLDAPLGIAIGEHTAPIGTCTVERSGDRFDLHLLAPLDR